MTQNDENNTPITTSSRRFKRWQVVLTIVLIILVLIAGALYSQQSLIRNWLTHSHISHEDTSTSGEKTGLTALKLPPGFRAEIFSTGLSGPRFITFSPDGILFVAERGSGSIIALPDPQHTGHASEKRVVVSGLDDPTSLVFYQGALYVGEASRVSRFTLDANLKITSKQVIVPDLPTGGNHITRTVLIGPDGNLYVSIGSTGY
ncbi:MAG TPA: hypothetical protein VGL94_06990 [Ktedonobacteraceae bacterium]|jgi:glucose/arabinose dehydrogenase